VIRTDNPLDGERDPEAFGPTDLVAASVGTCILTVMGIVARRRGWDL
jgi:putative redox protein